MHYGRSCDRWLKQHGMAKFVNPRSEDFDQDFKRHVQMTKCLQYIPISMTVGVLEKLKTKVDSSLGPYYDYLKEKFQRSNSDRLCWNDVLCKSKAGL